MRITARDWWCMYPILMIVPALLSLSATVATITLTIWLFGWQMALAVWAAGTTIFLATRVRRD